MRRETLVRAERVSRRFGEGENAFAALGEADFTVLEGDRIALVGPSGSGKSTMLHLMAGLDQPTEGKIEWPAIGPRDLLRPGPVALSFQGPSLLPPLDVLENISLPILLAGGKEAEARTRALEMIELFELADVVAKLPEELSGGQLQRAGLARALAGRPKLLLADEPTGQQDRGGGARIITVVLSCMDELEGSALVVATHDPLVARRLKTKWRIEGGRLDAGASIR